MRDSATRQPIDGARVGLMPKTGFNPSTFTAEVYTGPDGAFRFSSVPADSYLLSARCAGYPTGYFGQERPDDAQQYFDLRAGEDAKGVTLWLTPGGAISGAVRATSGDARVGASVRALVLGSTADGRPTLKSVLGVRMQHTDSRGEYRLVDLPPGSYLVEVSDADAPGQYLPDQYIRGYSANLDPSMIFYPDAPSPTGARPVEVGAGAVVPAIDFTVPATPKPVVGIAGRVTGASFDLAGQTLSLVTTDVVAGLPPWMELATTTVESSGAFAFSYVPPGTYEIRGVFAPPGPPSTWDPSQGGRPPILVESPSQPPALWCRQEITMRDEAVKDFVLHAQAGLRIRGRLTLAGDVANVDPSAVLIGVDPLSGWSVHGRTSRAQSDGTFRTVALPPGHYSISAFSQDGSIHADAETLLGRDVIATGVEVSAGDVSGLELTVTRARTSVTGSVQDASGKPRPDARVLWFRVGGAWQNGLFGAGSVDVGSMRTDRFGGYDVPGMPGDYYVIAVAGPLPTAWQNTEFLRALSALATKVTLARGATVRQDLVVRPVPTSR